MIEVQEYKQTRPKGGKRVVRVEKDGEVVIPFASYEMLTELLGFNRSDMKKITLVLSGERPSIRGYNLFNIGWLVQ